MKKTTLALLFAGTLMAASCGNNHPDSKDIAKEENKEKFDSSSIEDDTKFAVAAADGGIMEVELGKLALGNAHSSGVKTFAQQMVDDHTKVNDELMAWAKQKNVSLPSTMSSSKQDRYNDLAKKKGAEFDKAYISAMVGDHKDDIGAFRKEADKGKDTGLRAWASQKLPTLEHHLMMAQGLDSLLKK